MFNLNPAVEADYFKSVLVSTKTSDKITTWPIKLIFMTNLVADTIHLSLAAQVPLYQTKHHQHMHLYFPPKQKLSSGPPYRTDHDN